MTEKKDKQLHDVFDKLNDLQKQQVIDFAAHFLDEGVQHDKWEDKNFMAEMESRYDYYKSGGKMVSAEEVDRQVKELFNNYKR